MNNHEIKNQGAGGTCDEQKAEGTVEIKAMLHVLFREIQEVRVGVGYLSRAPHAAAYPNTQKVEPPDDNVARGVFDVIRKMELPAQHQKAPLVKVFQLYCVDALSAAQVARRCACSRSLVMLRLKQLRKKTGCDPARLRALASNAVDGFTGAG